MNPTIVYTHVGPLGQGVDVCIAPEVSFCLFVVIPQSLKQVCLLFL